MLSVGALKKPALSMSAFAAFLVRASARSNSCCSAAFVPNRGSLAGLCAAGASSQPVSSLYRQVRSVQGTSYLLRMSSGGEDDWYSDYDHREYDRYNKGPSQDGDYRGGNMDGGGGWGRRSSNGGGRRNSASSYDSSGHDYSRDASVDDAAVDEDAVNALIADRLRARKTGQFDLADDLRDRLRDDHGVSVWDRERVWTTGGHKPYGGGRGGGGGDRRTKSRRGAGEKRDFGPLGHDYSADPAAGPSVSSLSEDEVHVLLAERLRAKMSRDFRTADSIQVELADAGVYVHDGNKLWRADGVNFGLSGDGVRPGRERGSRNDRMSYRRRGGTGGYGEDELADIQALVEDRIGAKRNKNYDLADSIRVSLKEKYNVGLDDRSREWCIVTDKYALSSLQDFKDLPLSGDDVAYIEERISERAVAKLHKDYAAADNIAQELEDRFSVCVDDRKREWIVNLDKKENP